MLQTLSVLVLDAKKYSESSLVVQGYTRNHGMLSFLVSGVRKKKSRMKAGLFQPLQILELSAHIKESSNLIRPRAVSLAVPYTDLHTDIRKMSVCLFLSDFLVHCLRHEHANSGLFDFIRDSLLWSDVHEFHPDFHLVFMAGMASHMGLLPDTGSGNYFDLQNGKFGNIKSGLPQQLDEDVSQNLKTLLGMGFDDLPRQQFGRAERKALLNAWIAYYQLHLRDLSGLKSIEILQEILEA